MHQPVPPFDDDDEDLTPDADFALRHALRHALAREIGARRLRVRPPAAKPGPHAPFVALDVDDDAIVASYPRAVRQVA